MATRPGLTPLELRIMNILWDSGPSTVAEVQPQLEGDPAYTTVMTILNVLLRKGKVKRVQVGRAFRYRAAVTRQRATGTAVEDLITRMFAGSAEALVMTLVENKGITADDLDRLSRQVAEAERTPPEPPAKRSRKASR